MKNILIPMDFTQVALNALEYAVKLFETENIFIVHTTHGTYYNDSTFEEPKVEKKEILTTELEKDVLRVLRTSSIPENISIQILRGDTLPVLQKFCAENNIHSIVMGTRDKYNLFDKWLGTVSLSIVKTINLPVYLIPPFAKYKAYKSVLVASDYHMGNLDLVKEIKEWNLPHQAFIRFLNIKNSKESFKKEKEQIVAGIFEEDDPSFGFEIVSKSSEDISQSLLASAYNYGSDLLIAVPDNQNFLNSLLFKSVSKELILKSEIPLLFLHPDRKEK